MKAALAVPLALGIDLVAVTVLAYVIYFRRHRRGDLLFAYLALNTGIFAVSVLLMSQRVELAIGFGLFGVLSIIRLRSDAISQREVGYYFVALALGLVNGVSATRPAAGAALSALLLAVMYVADHPRLTGRVQRQSVVLDVIHRDEGALRADLAGRLGAPVLQVSVIEIDYVRDVMVLDVRYRAGTAAPVERGVRRVSATGVR
jgi:hypothetical protein